MASSSSSKCKSYGKPSQDQVFINFRGAELRNNFVSHLEKGLKRNAINAFIDTDEDMGEELNALLRRIEGSKIALAIFSPRYTESDWCLKELAKMKECKEQGRLVVIPVFYKVKPATVKQQRGKFGDKFRDLVKRFDKETKNEWTEALESIPLLIGLELNEHSNEGDFISRIVKEVKKALNNISRASPSTPPEVTDRSPSVQQKKLESSCGIDKRLKQLEEMLGFEENTRTIGVVGMPGIGKSTLVKKLYEKLKNGFLSHVLIQDIHETTMNYGLSYLPTILLEDLLKVKNPKFETVQAAHEGYKDQLLRTKALVILDNVSNKEQIVAILGKRDWIKQGSRIVIATSDKSLIHDSVDYIYEVPQLSYKHSLQHFTHYAFGDQSNAWSFLKLSKEFMHYTKGNPLALKVLGAELLGKDEPHWYSKLDALNQHHKDHARSSKKMLTQSSSEMLQSVWKGSYDGLSQQQKDTLLDIACFKSMDKNYVASLLESYGANSTDAEIEITELVNKFLITISSGKIEMHDILHMFSKELGREASAPDGKGRRRLWDHHTIIDVLDNNKGASSVRSIFLDLADVNMKRSFHNQAFVLMSNLRYLKIYNTNCPQECDADITLSFPDGLQLPLDEVRCLHWLKFPLKELPPDFKPEKLVDLKLHYSEIERLWEDNKDAPKLKWVNLNHSRNLSTLSALENAQSLQELHLESCTALKKLHVTTANMKCLVFLNLRGCTNLKSLPENPLISLKTLILSDCIKFKKFKVISDKLEALYLDGTAIKELPCDIRILQSLVLLNMKDCTKLKRLPGSLGELKALEELILSGCLKLKEFPKSAENMSHLEILLLDETAIEEIPKIFSVRRLCLSKNERIICLPDLINRFPRLQWLDLKLCKNLTHIPQLPPNLQCLDVRGCISLKTIAKPLVSSTPMKHINSTFIFTKCNKLQQSAKEEIAAYAERKCQLLSSALKRCDESCVPEILFCTSFPGCEIPSWFCHDAVGSMVGFEVPAHWNYNRLSGIALCVVVSFQDCQSHANLIVKFSCEQKTGEVSCTSITWKVGSLIEQDNDENTVESDHVFIGNTNCLDFIKLVEGQGLRKCAPTKASLEFSVTTGTGGEARIEILKSGFSFVFEPEDIKVPFPRNDEVKCKTMINGTQNANGYLKDQANGDESPKGHLEDLH